MGQGRIGTWVLVSMRYQLLWTDASRPEPVAAPAKPPAKPPIESKPFAPAGARASDQVNGSRRGGRRA